MVLSFIECKLVISNGSESQTETEEAEFQLTQD